ncbi:MAG: RDD family protein [Acidobacteria bacterium]|nr:RDD family protein [Acidobacteriota bacterium]
MTDANPYSPPQTYVADVKAPGAIRLATRSQRARGALVDVGVGLALLFGTCFPLFQRLGVLAASDPEWLPRAFSAVGLQFLINAYFLHTNGQTVGKRAVGTRIVLADGSRASLPRILGLRMMVPGFIGWVPIAGPLFGLVDTLFIYRDDRRCLHDHIAGTVVIAA